MMDEHQFYSVLEDWRSQPFSFVDSNCCQFSADIARCWGADIEVPGFDDAETAAQWFRDQGHRSLYFYLVKLFGRPVAPLQAKRGFIAYRKGRGLDGSAIGAVERKALFVSDMGLVEIPLSQCTGAFNPERFRG